MKQTKAKDLQKNYKGYYQNFDAPAYPDSVREAVETLIEANEWGQPMFRLVWGMDSNLTHWFRGETHMKYPSARLIHKWVDAVRILTPTGEERALITDKEEIARVVGEASTEINEKFVPDEIITPIYKEEIIEVGLPYFIVERFAYPWEFGTKEEWEAEQFEYVVVAGDERGQEHVEVKAIKVLDDYPVNGKYVQFIVVQTPDGMPRLPDNALVEELKEKIKYYESLPQDLTMARAQFESNKATLEQAKWAEWEEDLERAIQDRHKHFNTPQVSVL